MKSIAQAFIQSKLSEYSEPSRKGIKRGIRIGMHHNKYSAAVISAIFEMNSAELENVLDVPRNLISKWHTEKAFIQIMEEAREEFVIELNNAIINGINALIISDASNYSDKLKQMLFQSCKIIYERGDAEALFKMWPLIDKICSNCFNKV